MSSQSDVKTIHEFLADNPNIDVSKQWERCWNIHGKISDRILTYFGGAKLHPISEGADYYTSPDGQIEGAFLAIPAVASIGLFDHGSVTAKPALSI